MQQTPSSREIPALTSISPSFHSHRVNQSGLFTSFYTLLDASFPIVWATVGDFYGRKYFATIRGMLSFFYMWGSVAGPVLAGAIYDRSQSYTRVMWGLFLVLAVATLLNALLIKPWRRCATAAQLNN